MMTDSTRRFSNASAAQQRFLSLFLRSERAVFRYVAALVPNVTDAVEGYYPERASIDPPARRAGRSEGATYKMLQRFRHALRVCVESLVKPEVP